MRFEMVCFNFAHSGQLESARVSSFIDHCKSIFAQGVFSPRFPALIIICNLFSN